MSENRAKKLLTRGQRAANRSYEEDTETDDSQTVENNVVQNEKQDLLKPTQETLTNIPSTINDSYTPLTEPQRLQMILKKTKAVEQVFSDSVELQGVQAYKEMNVAELANRKQVWIQALNIRSRNAFSEKDLGQKLAITHEMTLEMHSKNNHLIEVLDTFYNPILKNQEAKIDSYDKFYDDLTAKTEKQKEDFSHEECMLNDNIDALDTEKNKRIINDLDSESLRLKHEVDQLSSEFHSIVEAATQEGFLEESEDEVNAEVEHLLSELVEGQSEDSTYSASISEIVNEDNQLNNLLREIEEKSIMESECTADLEEQLSTINTDNSTLQRFPLSDIDESIHNLYLPENFQSLSCSYNNMFKMNEDISKDMITLDENETYQKDRIQEMIHQQNLMSKEAVELQNEFIVMGMKLNDVKQGYLDKMQLVQEDNEKMMLIIHSIGGEIQVIENANKILLDEEKSVVKEFKSNLKKYAEMNLHMENMMQSKLNESSITNSSIPSVKVSPMRRDASSVVDPDDIMNISSEAEVNPHNLSQLVEDPTIQGEEDNVFEFDFVDDESVVSQVSNVGHFEVMRPRGPAW